MRTWRVTWARFPWMMTGTFDVMLNMHSVDRHWTSDRAGLGSAVSVCMFTAEEWVAAENVHARMKCWQKLNENFLFSCHVMSPCVVTPCVMMSLRPWSPGCWPLAGSASVFHSQHLFAVLSWLLYCLRNEKKTNLKQCWLPAFWKEIQNTQETKRMLFNWRNRTKHAKKSVKSWF